MLVPVKWLKEYLNIDKAICAEELASKMTMTGTNVESVMTMAEDISNVVVGKILSIEKHPNADKLVICQVDIGSEVIQIVTGAPNVEAGQLVPVAVHGATLPGGVKIKKGKLRGQLSQGMLCSGKELDLNDGDYSGAEVDGIMIFKEDYPLGLDIKDALDLGGDVIDFEITPNRADCLSIIGVAREAAVTMDAKFIPPSIFVKPGSGNINEEAKVQVHETELCPRYCAKVIKDVKIGQSPLWMRRKLAAAGVRPINNIVDITNYVMLEMGQPMHAFDLDKISDRTIIVRKANSGEKIKTLDNVERQLTEDMLVIADTQKAIAVAGVMGGANSEVTETTNTILLESAKFDGKSIRLTSRALGLRSEASGRFEKGLDIYNPLNSINRAAQLIQELGIGSVVEGTIDAFTGSLEPHVIETKWANINKLLGVDLSAGQICDILRSLDFIVEQNNDMIKVTLPSYRQDVEGMADLAEEVARIYGYDKIPMTLMEGSPAESAKTREQKLKDRVKEILIGAGLYEAITYSFASPKVYSTIGITNPDDIPSAVKIANPLGEDQSFLRTTLIPNILEVLGRNYSRNIDKCNIFEVNRIFLPKKDAAQDELPIEKTMLTIGKYGDNVDFYDLKGIIELLLNELGLKDSAEFSPYNPPTFHPGRTAILSIGEDDIGILGEVHPKVGQNYQLEIPVYVAELDFDKLVHMAKTDKYFKSLPKYPAVTRDMAIVVSKDIPAGQLEKVIRQIGGSILEDVKLFDIYEGVQIPKGNKSMAYSITYRADDRTLKDEEVSKVHQSIIDELQNRFDVKLR